jgi:hypothetical protein
MAGQASFRAAISGVNKSTQCEVTTDAAHGYTTNEIVRITDLGIMMPTPRGMTQINNKSFTVFVNSNTTFLLRDSNSLEYIDSTNFTTYVSNGNVNLENTIFLWSAT